MRREADPASVGLMVTTGAFGLGLCGLLIARLTLKLNPHLTDGPPLDVILLFAYFGLGYAAVGVALGAVAGIAVRVLSVVPALRRPASIAAASALLLGPLLYFLLLPDVGFGHGILSGVIFGASRARLLGTLAGMAALLLAAGFLLAAVVRSLAGRLKMSEPRLVGLVWIFAAVSVLASEALIHARPRRPPPPVAAPVEVVTPDPLPPRLVLLCIDGCDLDDMVQPMVDRGELPTFARIMKDGAWGPLATIEPTLSAVVWTTIITGKRPDQHGIRHFIVFRLPGISKAIYMFPRHTGLNFRVFPALERLPGMPALQAPYTSNMRRAEALWGIAGRAFPVGAYRWLITWPVEPVNGFDIAGGVGWLQIMSAFEESAGGSLDRGFKYPRDVFDRIPRAPVIPDVTREMLDPYIGAGFDPDMSNFRIKALAQALRDPTGWELPRLIHEFDTRFTAANFYNVDEFCHLFAVNKDKGGVFSNAVAERYRYADARLGEFLAAMGDSVNVIVVSDHGYDFVQNHHTDAPAGVFFGIGPAFVPGRRVEGLSVYDIAPLCLRLLDLPVPTDMPHADRFEEAPDYLRGVAGRGFVTTYETGERRDAAPMESPIDDLIKEQLRTLGYIN